MYNVRDGAFSQDRNTKKIEGRIGFLVSEASFTEKLTGEAWKPQTYKHLKIDTKLMKIVLAAI